MSWLIIGNNIYAGFACDTGMETFGPLHECHGSKSAVDSLRKFAETLDEDPRKLYNRGELRNKYIEWAKT